MSKNLVLMRDVIIKHHPRFRKNPSLCQHGLESPDDFNIEHLVELTLAEVGGLRFVNQAGYDFLPDYSDSKTVSVNENTRKAEIHSVENKIGALRITAYNPHTHSVDFFFVPHRDLLEIKLPCYGVSAHKERVMFTYSEPGHYNSFENFRVNSFKELAKARG